MFGNLLKANGTTIRSRSIGQTNKTHRLSIEYIQLNHEWTLKGSNRLKIWNMIGLKILKRGHFSFKISEYEIWTSVDTLIFLTKPSNLFEVCTLHLGAISIYVLQVVYWEISEICIFCTVIRAVRKSKAADFCEYIWHILHFFMKIKFRKKSKATFVL